MPLTKRHRQGIGFFQTQSTLPLPAEMRMFQAKETGLFCLLSSCLRLIADVAASSSSPHPPVLLGLPPHGWCRGVLHLAPSIAASRYIAGRFALRHDAL